MPFTDDDLKRLKEHAEEAQAKGIMKNWTYVVSNLLARLEAAEAFCIESDQPRYSMSMEQAELFNAWRKAAGK